MLATEHEQLETLADLLEQLGNVPLERIRLPPFPGTATVDDVIRLCDGEPKRQCELVDGVLVEKVYGHPESRLAARLLQLLQNDLDEHDLGILTGADGPLQIRFIALFWGMPRDRGGFSRHLSDVQWLQGDTAICCNAAARSSGGRLCWEATAKEYPGLRCGKRVSDPGRGFSARVAAQVLHLDIGAMPP